MNNVVALLALMMVNADEESSESAAVIEEQASQLPADFPAAATSLHAFSSNANASEVIAQALVNRSNASLSNADASLFGNETVPEGARIRSSRLSGRSSKQYLWHLQSRFLVAAFGSTCFLACLVLLACQRWVSLRIRASLFSSWLPCLRSSARDQGLSQNSENFITSEEDDEARVGGPLSGCPVGMRLNNEIPPPEVLDALYYNMGSPQ
mmetsp:Transcript_102372/g.159700  ORF Transcript_102372/g.159700 Transcript_102372/m.159700 type:complete len:210 (-) Transcript_102372:59-688(-)